MIYVFVVGTVPLHTVLSHLTHQRQIAWSAYVVRVAQETRLVYVWHDWRMWEMTHAYVTSPARKTIHTRTRTPTHTHAHTNTHTHTQSHAHTHTHTHTHTHARIRTHTRTHALICTNKLTHTHHFRRRASFTPMFSMRHVAYGWTSPVVYERVMSHTNECVTVAHTSVASSTERRAALSERHACRCVPLSVKDISTASSTESGTHHKGLLTHSISHVWHCSVSQWHTLMALGHRSVAHTVPFTICSSYTYTICSSYTQSGTHVFHCDALILICRTRNVRSLTTHVTYEWMRHRGTQDMCLVHSQRHARLSMSAAHMSYENVMCVQQHTRVW